MSNINLKQTFFLLFVSLTILISGCETTSGSSFTSVSLSGRAAQCDHLWTARNSALLRGDQRSADAHVAQYRSCIDGSSVASSSLGSVSLSGRAAQCEHLWTARNSALLRGDQRSADAYVAQYRSCIDGSPAGEGTTALIPSAPVDNANSDIRQSASTALRASEPVKSTLELSVSASKPDNDGVFILSITTKTDTASLKIDGDEAGGRIDGRYTVPRFAKLGANRVEVIAIDRFGNKKTEVVSVVREPADTSVRFATLNPGALRGKPTANAVAIIIGIQDYRRVPKADFANNDARVFYDYAIRGLGVRPENVKLLVDQQADDIEILGAFRNWLPLKAKRGQTDVYVFYSGHGLPSDDGASLYFLPHGVDRQFLDRTAIKQAEIISALEAVSPKSVTLFLDACYSGQSRGGETLLVSARPIAIQPKASAFPANFTVLSASAPQQIASSSPELKHGIFSYFLMKGMEGEADQNKDGTITTQEMYSYLSDSVGRKAMALNRTQQPQVLGDQSRVLVVR